MPQRRSRQTQPPPEAAFGRRLAIACDNFPECPQLHHGRLAWIVESLRKKFGVKVSAEAARKWHSGENRPRPNRMSVLAQLLQVDEGWLSIGGGTDDSTDQRRAQNANAGGPVNIVAGLIELNGGHLAFPQEGTTNAAGVDIFAVVRGRAYSFKVSVGQRSSGKNYTFEIPMNYREVSVLGLIQTGSFQFDLLEFGRDIIAKHGRNRGGHLEISADKRGAFYFVGKDRVLTPSIFEEAS